MRARIIVESCFGNTHAIAEALAEGLRSGGAEVTVAAAAEAGPVGPDVGLVVLAAPTHNMSLPTPASRDQAVKRGGQAPASGVREWIAAAAPISGARLVTVDTAAPGPFSGSAAKDAQRRAKARGWRAERGPSFLMAGEHLRDGELERARQLGTAWAAGR